MNETVVIIAGGPSITEKDVRYIESRDVDILGINDAYRICNRLDYLYACDRRWWMHHWSRVKPVLCRKFALEEQGFPGVEQMKNGGISGLSFEWPKLRTGKNSGYQAINLAILLGYKRIVLLGYDMQHTFGKVHWFGNHPKPLNNAPQGKFKEWIGLFEKMVESIPADTQIINCTRQTALECFPKVKLEDVI